MAVPALPRKSAASFTFSRPPRPRTSTVDSPSGVTSQPRVRRASSITRVSSESSRSRMRVSPSLSRDSSSTRLEMLLEPGIRSIPLTALSGGRSRNGLRFMARIWGHTGRRARGCRLLKGRARSARRLGVDLPAGAQLGRVADEVFECLAVAGLHHVLEGVEGVAKALRLLEHFLA